MYGCFVGIILSNATFSDRPNALSPSSARIGSHSMTIARRSLKSGRPIGVPSAAWATRWSGPPTLALTEGQNGWRQHGASGSHFRRHPRSRWRTSVL